MLLEFKDVFKRIISDKVALINLLIAALIFALPEYLNSLMLMFAYMAKHSIMPVSTAVPIVRLLKGLTSLAGIVSTPFWVGFLLHVAHSYIHTENKIPVWEGTKWKFFSRGFLFNNIIILLYVVALLGIVGILFYSVWDQSAVSQIVSLAKARSYGPMFNHMSVFLPAIAVMVVLVIVFASIYQFIMCAYAENFKFVQAFNLVSVFKKVFSVFPQYVLYLIVFFVIGILCAILNVVLNLLLIGFIVNPLIVFAEFFAQTVVFALLYRNAILKEGAAMHNVEVIE